MRANSTQLLGICTISLWLIAPSAVHAYTENVLYNFCETQQGNCPDGYYPLSIISDNSGNFYGVTSEGGVNNSGTAWALWLNKDGSRTFQTIYTFCSKNAKGTCTDGSRPYGQLIIDTSGKLYGVTSEGGTNNRSQGVVYELIPNGGKPYKSTVLHNFCSDYKCQDGAGSSILTYLGESSGQTYDGRSPLFGEVMGGGPFNDGAIFELSLDQEWTYNLIYGFDDPQGQGAYSPRGGLIIDASGNLFGVGAGGSNAMGTVFEVTNKSGNWTDSVLYDFCHETNCNDGSRPDAQLYMDSNGNLFGTTFAGGNGKGGGSVACLYSGCGTVFELSQTDHESVLFDFCSLKKCKDGWLPNSPLTADNSGNFFGTTQGGGKHEAGTVFMLSGTSVAMVYSFCAKQNCTDGNHPGFRAGVIEDGAGNLYGVTSSGGASSSGYGGTIYELSP